MPKPYLSTGSRQQGGQGTGHRSASKNGHNPDFAIGMTLHRPRRLISRSHWNTPNLWVGFKWDDFKPVKAPQMRFCTAGLKRFLKSHPDRRPSIVPEPRGDSSMSATLEWMQRKP